MNYNTRLTMLMAILGMTFSSLAGAAEVPAGTKLAADQQLVRGNGADPATLDPQQAESDESFSIIQDSFAGLVSLDAQGKLHPALASTWETKDHTVWTFHLRPGIKWSDNSPITAQDVVFSWQRLADPKIASPYQSFLLTASLSNVREVVSGKLPVDKLGVVALDNHTVQITLSQPVAEFLQIVASPSLYPVSQAAVKKYGDKWTQPQNIVVSGAYKPVKWIVNERLISVRNPHYWNNAATVINQVTYLPIAEPSATLNRYQSGEIDITNTIPTVNFRNLKQSIPEQIVRTPQLGIYMYWFNLTKPPFNDRRVRMALNLAVDKSVITDKVLGMGQKPAWTLMPLTIGGESYQPPEVAEWRQEQRIAQAKTLLAEAGFNAQHPLQLELLYNTSQDHQKIAVALASMWKKTLGAQVIMQNQEWKTLLQSQHNGNFQLSRSTWVADYNHPSSFLYNYMIGNSQNNGKYSNPEYDRLVNQASAETDVAKAKQDYQQASDILAKDVPAIPLYYFVKNQLVKPWVGGLKVSSLGIYKTQDIYIRQH